MLARKQQILAARHNWSGRQVAVADRSAGIDGRLLVDGSSVRRRSVSARRMGISDQVQASGQHDGQENGEEMHGWRFGWLGNGLVTEQAI